LFLCKYQWQFAILVSFHDTLFLCSHKFSTTIDNFFCSFAISIIFQCFCILIAIFIVYLQHLVNKWYIVLHPFYFHQKTFVLFLLSCTLVCYFIMCFSLALFVFVLISCVCVCVCDLFYKCWRCCNYTSFLMFLTKLI